MRRKEVASGIDDARRANFYYIRVHARVRVYTRHKQADVEESLRARALVIM